MRIKELSPSFVQHLLFSKYRFFFREDTCLYHMNKDIFEQILLVLFIYLYMVDRLIRDFQQGQFCRPSQLPKLLAPIDTVLINLIPQNETVHCFRTPHLADL